MKHTPGPFETLDDGHDFFSREMCDEMIEMRYVPDDYFEGVLDAADIEVTPENLRDARIVAYETMIAWLKELNQVAEGKP